jgi:hypothetical protein
VQKTNKNIEILREISRFLLVPMLVSFSTLVFQHSFAMPGCCQISCFSLGESPPTLPVLTFYLLGVPQPE